MPIVAIIPARGGSKGIPRKNLRPLANKPLIFYSIDACLNADSVDEVVVTTDDDEIALLAERFGANVVMRPAHLSDDVATLDPVIAHAAEVLERQKDIRFDLIVTVQPTSPLVLSEDIDLAITKFENAEVDSVISVVEDVHLCWGIEDNEPVPRYAERVNRQSLPLNYKETGAIIACRRAQISKGTRIGSKVALHMMPHARSFDIDSLPDLYLCEAMLMHKHIVITAVGRPDLGMGHVFRVALLANELVQHKIEFVCEEADILAFEYLSTLNYKVRMVNEGERLNEILELKPDLVINDILDTDLHYMMGLKSAGLKVVNFEDIGPGAEHADIVVNALYPNLLPSDRVLTGERYFCLRDEFLYLSDDSFSDDVKRVLLTFGGIDENNLTSKVLVSIVDTCKKNNIHVDIVVGPGFAHEAELLSVIRKLDYEGVEYISATKRISDYMLSADVAITSGGRTVFELVAVGVPTVVLCQNEREETHTFASSEHGIINLGLCHTVESEFIAEAFTKLVDDKRLREIMRAKMDAVDLRGGKARVIGEIKALIMGKEL
jgi:CMP-N-acetylneuraminic acid synthetase/spore coat polysaccharide biosynthesis predicted glycosyltransferase SpsG